MSFPNDRTYSFDINLQLADGAIAQTATGYSQSGGVTGNIDLGGNQGASPAQQARIDACCVIDVSALNIVTGDEYYKFMLVGSTDPAFGSGNVVNLGAIEVGKGSAIPDIINGKDSVTGRLELLFCTQVAGNLMEFLQLYVVMGGTSPSITYTAFVAVLPEP